MDSNYYVISFAPGCIEGLKIGVENKELSFCDEAYTKLWETDVIREPEQDLEEFIKFHHWEQGYIRAILPTSLVSTRSFYFPFSDPKKIKQTLHSRVESELLQEIETVQLAYEIFPIEQAGAEVVVYTAPKSEIERLEQVASQYNLLLYEVSFSGHALLNVLPDYVEGNFYQIYFGVEEVFVNYTHNKNLLKNKFFQSSCLEIVEHLLETELEIEANEETELEEDEAFAILENTSRSDDATVFEDDPRKELIQELEQICEQLNFFLRTMPKGEVKLYGRLALLVHFDGEKLMLQTQKLDEWIKNSHKQWGILSTLSTNIKFIVSKRSPVTFYSKTMFLGFLMMRKFAFQACTLSFLLIATITSFSVSLFWEDSLSEQLNTYHDMLIRERLQILLPDSPVQTIPQGVQLLKKKSKRNNTNCN